MQSWAKSSEEATTEEEEALAEADPGVDLEEEEAEEALEADRSKVPAES